MSNFSTFAGRLMHTIGDQSVNSFAKKSGISESAMRSYASGTMPSIDKAEKIARVGNVSLMWLITGEGSPETCDAGRFGLEDNRQADFSHEGLVDVPVINVTASAGGGALVIDEKSVGVAAFNEEYLRTNWHVNPKELFCMPVDGESMEPTIKPGEFMLVSYAERHKSPGDGIYIIRLDGSVLVKRIQLLPGGKIKIFSDNAAYEPFEITLSDGVDFSILGKVVLVHGLRRV